MTLAHGGAARQAGAAPLGGGAPGLPADGNLAELAARRQECLDDVFDVPGVEVLQDEEPGNQGIHAAHDGRIPLVVVAVAEGFENRAERLLPGNTLEAHGGPAGHLGADHQTAAGLA